MKMMTMIFRAEEPQATINWSWLFFFFFFHTIIAKAQTWKLETNGQVGYHIAIHPNYPRLQNPTSAGELSVLQATQGNSIWSILYGYPTVVYSLSYQTLGNPAVLGNAVSLVPALDFELWQSKRWSWRGRVGWGVGFIDKHYHSFDNPTNIVIGTTVNACFSLRTALLYRLSSHWQLLLGGGITHYSNARLTIPNLGANIPFASLGIQYTLGLPQAIEVEKNQEKIKELPTLQQGIRPYLELGLGLTERGGTQGVKYPVYILQAGVSRRMSRISKLSIGVEYLYNHATYNFDRNNGGVAYQHFDYSRIAVLLTHELLFGHWGFVSGLGVYTNTHRYQRSLLVAKLGFNLYLQNYFKRQQHQVWVGCHVRAYGGEAELVQLVLGYNF